MSRLVQGDVGSGKTAVAAAALWAAVTNGAQGAMMAPTEILAEQHARSLGRMFASLRHPLRDRPVRVALFTGSMSQAERDSALADLQTGEIDIAVGTHALIQPDVAFRDLAVAVVDEQHRFGVEQRAALRQKAVQPHMLVMSATPIPRSLALTIYGDLDVSVIDEMPAGRIPIKTKWLTTTQRERAYSFIRRQVSEGRQAFIVYPLVEEGVQPGVPSAVEEHARLSREVFPDLRIGLLHGRMRGDEKDAVMRAFGAGELDVLAATSVVEVGIDVPNASVIVIEGAERFGLAQLHQFRGRVGRGQHPSYCILISDAASGDSAQRLQALETNNDGFALAQLDLEMRGPGDFFGTRQSGLPPLQTAELGDLRTLETARAAAQQIFKNDPLLVSPEHQALAAQVARFWAATGDVS
jgi:ATP-dependent DNA helicase RecG